MNKKRLLTLLLMALIVFLPGCRSFLIPQDSPIIVNDEGTGTVNVKQLKSLGSGIIRDISPKGDYLLVSDTSSTPPITFNLELYKATPTGWTVVNFQNSDKQQTGPVFDNTLTGVYYGEKSTGSTSDTAVSQVVWTSLDRTSTKVLSQTDENLATPLCRFGNNGILYANDQSELVAIASGSERRVYTMASGYTMTATRYNTANNTLYFIGEQKDSASANLYALALTGEGSKLKPALIAEDVTHFSISPDGSQLIYIQQSGGGHAIFNYQIAKKKTSLVSNSGDYTQAIFNNDASRIIASQYATTHENRLETIWIMDADGQNRLQMTSPHQIASDLFLAPSGNTLYFSVEEELNNAASSLETTNFSNTVYQLDFTVD
jgi:dipeptidyl aminopeptidase/acylaminoacyl peptidase